MQKSLLALLFIGMLTASPTHTISSNTVLKSITNPVFDVTKSVGTWMYRHPLAAMGLTNVVGLLLLNSVKESDAMVTFGVTVFVTVNGLLYLHAITAPVIDGVNLTAQLIGKHPKLSAFIAAGAIAVGTYPSIL